MDWMERIHNAVVQGEKNEIAKLATEAVKNRVPAQRILDEAMIPAMNKVAELWRIEEYFLPEVLRSAKTMQTGMDTLRSYLAGSIPVKPIKVAIGTVKGDRHDIGKNLVGILLESMGYQVEDLGVDVPPERFLEAAQKGAKVLGLSSLLTTAMNQMKTVIELLEKSGLRDELIIMVGGAPVTKDFAMRIGADHYAENAAEAVDILNDLYANRL